MLKVMHPSLGALAIREIIILRKMKECSLSWISNDFGYNQEYVTQYVDSYIDLERNYCIVMTKYNGTLYDCIPNVRAGYSRPRFNSNGTVSNVVGGSDDVRKQCFIHNVQYIAYALCCGLAQIHGQGYIHGDLKPENVLMKSMGSNRELVSDVGCRMNGSYSPNVVAARNLPHSIPPYLAGLKGGVDYCCCIGDFGSAVGIDEVLPLYAVGNGLGIVNAKKNGLVIDLECGNDGSATQVPMHKYGEYSIQSLPYRAPEVLVGVFHRSRNCVVEVEIEYGSSSGGKGDTYEPLKDSLDTVGGKSFPESLTRPIATEAPVLPLDYSMDMWSLGIIILEICLGFTLFSHSEPQEQWAALQATLSVSPVPAYNATCNCSVCGTYQVIDPIISGFNPSHRFCHASHLVKIKQLILTTSVYQDIGQSLTPSFIHFLCACLHPCPRDRITAQGARLHPYFRTVQLSGAALGQPVGSGFESHNRGASVISIPPVPKWKPKRFVPPKRATVAAITGVRNELVSPVETTIKLKNGGECEAVESKHIDGQIVAVPSLPADTGVFPPTSLDSVRQSVSKSPSNNKKTSILPPKQKTTCSASWANISSPRQLNSKLCTSKVGVVFENLSHLIDKNSHESVTESASNSESHTIPQFVSSPVLASLSVTGSTPHLDIPVRKRMRGSNRIAPAAACSASVLTTLGPENCNIKVFQSETKGPPYSGSFTSSTTVTHVSGPTGGRQRSRVGSACAGLSSLIQLKPQSLESERENPDGNAVARRTGKRGLRIESDILPQPRPGRLDQGVKRKRIIDSETDSTSGGDNDLDSDSDRKGIDLNYSNSKLKKLSVNANSSNGSDSNSCISDSDYEDAEIIQVSSRRNLGGGAMSRKQ